jgi:hypothetical protein
MPTLVKDSLSALPQIDARERSSGVAVADPRLDGWEMVGAFED